MDQGAGDGSAARMLPDLVADQMAATPAAIAVVDQHRELSYAELIRRADRLAADLRDTVDRADAVVAVCLPRSVDLVVALLGVWRAGLGYVPLDPAHPEARLAWQLADTGAPVVLTDSACAGAVRRAAGGDVTVVCLDPDPAGLAFLPAPGAGAGGSAEHPRSADPAGCPVAGDQAAYAIYTSGSSGRPKGVLISHAGIANRVLWTVRRHGLGPGDRVLQKTALTFDAAAWEIFAPLVSGGTVVMAPVGAERDPAALVRALGDYRITVLQVVPSVLRLLVDEPGWSRCDALRLVFSAGEPLHAELCQRLLRHVEVEIWNTYGPTECSIDATAFRFDPAQQTGPVSIGRPIDNVQVLVLDEAGALVPVGVPGELHIGGAGLARGYLGRPGRTARSFVPNRYGPPGSRLYRTGDLVRWSADGTLAYLGRLDNQLKVNGVRVEPAEVEAALMRHPDIASAAVKGYTDASGATRLAAYVLDRDVPRPETLRGFLSGHLPPALVPSAFVAVAAFPTTTSGKVDRAALPDPDPAGGTHRAPYHPPSTPSERLVAEVWSALLGIDRVGRSDDFFQLGGSSLLITRLANQLSAAAGTEVTVPDLFHAVTVADQARLLDGGGAEAGPIRRLERDRALPLSFGQTRQWLLDRMQPGSVEWLAPMFLDVPADISTSTVQRALDTLAARHESLRTRYVVAADGEPAQVIDRPRGVALRVVTAGGATNLAELFRQEFAHGFDLEQGHLIRGLLVRTPGADHTLLLTMHHIACDGWSTVVLEAEFRELCAAFAAGRESRLPELAMQYADFASWQREWLDGERLDRELAYWRKALDGVDVLELPLDRPRPAEWDPHGGLVTFEVPARLSGEFVALGRRLGATPFMTLLTAYSVLLSRYSGQVDVPVGVPVSGRLHPQIAGVVGFFVNSLVLRCDLANAPSFLDALGRVRDMSLSAFAHQALPFERLVDELVVERDPGRTPLYQVEFDMHEEGWTGTALDAAGMGAFAQSWAVAKSDLCLYLQRRDDGSMSGAVEYARALFDHETVDRFGQSFVRLLEAIVASPDQPVWTLDLLTAGERALVGADRGSGVLDRFGNPAPTGVPGEIHVAGVGTGQLGRRCPDGGVERLGQIEDQIRVRGVWVDRRRVETALASHPAVDQAVVGLVGVDGGAGRLRAYWTATGDTGDAADLAAYCAAALPAHQVPAQFVRVAAIPRTAGAAVDWSTLAGMAAPTPGGAADGGAEDEHGARAAAEQRIAEIWSGLLGVEVDTLDTETSFFSLGGNSILAIRMISTIREEFGVEVSIRAFFEHATVAKLAEQVAAQILAELAELSDSEVLAELNQPAAD